MKNIIKRQGTKGFTLMEMLIVVAIIAILIAIAFPIFNKQLNRARVATDAANIRTGYANATITIIESPNISVQPGFVLHEDGFIGNDSNDRIYRTLGNANQKDCEDIVEDLKSCGIDKPWTAGQSVWYKYNRAEGKLKAYTK